MPGLVAKLKTILFLMSEQTSSLKANVSSLIDALKLFNGPGKEPSHVAD